MQAVIHDPDLASAVRAPSIPKQGLMTRLGRLIGLVEEDEPVRRLAIEPEPVVAEQPAIEALAVALAELIASAQSRVDGAATLIGKSADEALAYRHALTSNADMLDEATSSTNVAAALIEVTRSMIERTRGAEERLRAMGEELQTMQRDLEDARECAERDPLTGLPNRRALEAALTQAVETARRANDVLSLAFCDIDHFKALNDTHGHAVGDRVLRLVGDCLTDGADESVFVGRQGGEEFVMLFQGVGAEEAAVKVDLIRAKLYGRTFRSRTDDAPLGNISFSAGVAMLQAHEDGDDLLRRADAALYRAKNHGRNRVEIDRSV